MGHSNSIAANVPFMRRLLERGVYIQFDTLGRVGSRLGGVDDGKVALGIVELIKAGYGDRILLSQDVCHKIELKKYGGTGYSYVLEFVVPELTRLGVTAEQIHKILVENPRRVLTFAAPAALRATARDAMLEESIETDERRKPSAMKPAGEPRAAGKKHV